MMGRVEANVPVDVAAILPLERARLVRLCAQLTGTTQGSEDLAQETLVEAWRHADKLRDQEGARLWLSAIARNVCRRWAYKQGRDAAHLAPALAADACDRPSAGARLVDDHDLTLDLEHDELADLLDRALAMLPKETGQALVQHYVEGLPQAEVAARLGIREGAVAVRLHRGKVALRRILQQDLYAEAATYGLGDQDTDASCETHIWCPFCGYQRLRMHLDRTTRAAAFRCPTCSSEPGTNVVFTRQPDLLHGVRSHKAILSRQLGALHRTLSHALETGVGPCIVCGRSVNVRRVAPGVDRLVGGAHAGIYACCDHCYAASPSIPWFDRGASALRLPETQRFWRLHARMRALPDRPLTYAGQSAVLTRYQGLSGPTTLDIISARDTFDILAVHAAASAVHATASA